MSNHEELMQQLHVVAAAPTIKSNAAHTLSTDGLPDKVVEICRHIAEECSVPMEPVLLSALTIAGGAIGANVTSKICGFENRPGLWCMIVAPSGSGKTRPIEALMQPLHKIDNDLAKEYDTKRMEWNATNAKAVNPTTRPKKTQIICGTDTDAGRVEFLCDNPRGGIYYRDELRSLFDSFKGTCNTDARNRFCEIADFGRIKVTTKTDDVIRISNHSFLPILGGIQPRVLPKAIRPDDIDQGLMQRFIVCNFDTDGFPKMMSGLKSDVMAGWDTIVQSLYAFGNIVWTFEPSEEAAKVYAEEYAMFVDLAKNDTGESDDYNDYKRTIVLKTLKFVHRVALIAHCLKIVCDAPEYPFAHPQIAPETIRWAFACAPYIVEQQMNAYNLIMGKNVKRKTDAQVIQEFAQWYRDKRGEKINRSQLAELTGIKRANISLYLREEGDENGGV